MNDMMISKKIKYVLLSPPFILSVCIMLINDHMLKGSGFIHPVITGKISDFAFLFFVPIAVAYVFRVKTTTGLFVSYFTGNTLNIESLLLNLNLLMNHN